MCASYDRLMCRCAECADAARIQRSLGTGYEYVATSFSDERYLEAQESSPIAPPIDYEVGDYHGCSRCGAMDHKITRCRPEATIIAPAAPREPEVPPPPPPKRGRGRPPGGGRLVARPSDANTFVWRGKVRQVSP